MKANELRIGNWVSYITAEGAEIELQINCESFKWISEDPIGFNLVHFHIPITPEWLERFGFENRGNNLFVKGKIELRYYANRCEVVVRGINITYQYVHQLQNLYFALTGEELELKQNI